jgi:hypothetical protein
MSQCKSLKERWSINVNTLSSSPMDESDEAIECRRLPKKRLLRSFDAAEEAAKQFNNNAAGKWIINSNGWVEKHSQYLDG